MSELSQAIEYKKSVDAPQVEIVTLPAGSGSTVKFKMKRITNLIGVPRYTSWIAADAFTATSPFYVLDKTYYRLEESTFSNKVRSRMSEATFDFINMASKTITNEFSSAGGSSSYPQMVFILVNEPKKKAIFGS